MMGISVCYLHGFFVSFFPDFEFAVLQFFLNSFVSRFPPASMCSPDMRVAIAVRW